MNEDEEWMKMKNEWRWMKIMDEWRWMKMSNQWRWRINEDEDEGWMKMKNEWRWRMNEDEAWMKMKDCEIYSKKNYDSFLNIFHIFSYIYFVQMIFFLGKGTNLFYFILKHRDWVAMQCFRNVFKPFLFWPKPRIFTFLQSFYLFLNLHRTFWHSRFLSNLPGWV